jgi:hypothetical protein
MGVQHPPKVCLIDLIQQEWPETQATEEHVGFYNAAEEDRGVRIRSGWELDAGDAGGAPFVDETETADPPLYEAYMAVLPANEVVAAKTAGSSVNDVPSQRTMPNGSAEIMSTVVTMITMSGDEDAALVVVDMVDVVTMPDYY